MITTTPSPGAGAFLFKRKPKPFRDLSGQQFGRLTVISRAENPGRAIRWNCLCTCGTECIVIGASLIRGATKSCGCLRRDASRKRMTVHGHTANKKQTSEWWAWFNACQRCGNPKNPLFASYGGRGITVQPEWDCPKTGFQAFLNHIGSMPQPGLSLDRIDNDRGYVIGNIRWADRHTQVRNRRSNRWIEGLGSKRILTDWAQLLGVSPSKLSAILRDCGELFFAAMALRPSLLGMMSLAEWHAQADEERHRTAQEKVDVLEVAAI